MSFPLTLCCTYSFYTSLLFQPVLFRTAFSINNLRVTLNLAHNISTDINMILHPDTITF